MRRLAWAASLLVVAACAAPMPSPSVTPIAEPAPPARTAAPTDMSSPSLPSATDNRPAHSGAPPIADPYWLLYSGTSTSTFTDTEGVEAQVDQSDNYRVIDGGSLEGTILVNGEWVGLLDVTVTEGEAIPGLDPIEQQYGAQIDDVLPVAEALPPPNPYWSLSTRRYDGLDIFVRVPAEDVDNDSFVAEAFWWDEGHETWYQVTTTADALDPVLVALLGPRQD